MKGALSVLVEKGFCDRIEGIVDEDAALFTSFDLGERSGELDAVIAFQVLKDDDGIFVCLFLGDKLKRIGHANKHWHLSDVLCVGIERKHKDFVFLFDVDAQILVV